MRPSKVVRYFSQNLCPPLKAVDELGQARHTSDDGGQAVC